MFAPMSFGELLDGAFGLYRRHFALLVGVSALAYGPFQIFSLYAGDAGGWIAHPWLLAVAVLVVFFGSLIGAAAILKIIADGYLGREGTIQAALAFGVGKLWPLFVTGLARSILTALASILLIIPGIIVACGYSVVNQVVVLEDLPESLDALGRSWALTKGFRWRALGLSLVLGIVAAIPGMIAGMLAVAGLGLPAKIVGAVAGILLSPLLPCGLTLFYYDLRVRKEAFDLEALGSLMGGTAS